MLPPELFSAIQKAESVVIVNDRAVMPRYSATVAKRKREAAELKQQTLTTSLHSQQHLHSQHHLNQSISPLSLSSRWSERIETGRDVNPSLPPSHDNAKNAQQLAGAFSTNCSISGHRHNNSARFKYVPKPRRSNEHPRLPRRPSNDAHPRLPRRAPSFDEETNRIFDSVQRS